MEKKITARTAEVVLNDIKVNITNFNLTADPAEKNKLELELKNLETEYNLLSLHNTWAEFVAAENPMVAFAKAYEYDIIGHKDPDLRKTVDGVMKITRTRVIDESKTRLLNVKEFVEWTEACGQSAAHDKHWRKAVTAARDAIIAEWKSFMATKDTAATHTVSFKKMHVALQEMVDALVFVKGAKGGNAVIVKRDTVKAAFAFCTQRKDGLKGSIMSEAVWKKLQMDVLHAAVAGKTFTISYGDEEDVLAETSDTTAEEKSDAK